MMRSTPIKPGTKRMRSGRSTGTPTKAEAAWIVACKEGPCMACVVWQQQGRAPHGWSPLFGCDYHHMKSGNVRRGHEFGIGLCPWHHRAVPDFDCTPAQMRQMAGPSLMDGSRLFHATYGSDDELIALQIAQIGAQLPTATRGNT